MPIAKISTATASHYVWGEVCSGWHLVNSPGLSVIQERMPAGSSESKHYHQRSRQFFYVLKGALSMKFSDETVVLSEGQGLEIPPGVVHQAENASGAEVDFMVISQPHSHGDKIPVR